MVDTSLAGTMSASALETFIETLQRQNKASSIILRTLETMTAVINTIIKNPYEDVYRIVSIKNTPGRTFRFDGAIELMLSVGFVEDTDATLLLFPYSSPIPPLLTFSELLQSRIQQLAITFEDQQSSSWLEFAQLRRFKDMICTPLTRKASKHERSLLSLNMEEAVDIESRCQAQSLSDYIQLYQTAQRRMASSPLSTEAEAEGRMALSQDVTRAVGGAVTSVSRSERLVQLIEHTSMEWMILMQIHHFVDACFRDSFSTSNLCDNRSDDSRMSRKMLSLDIMGAKSLRKATGIETVAELVRFSWKRSRALRERGGNDASVLELDQKLKSGFVTSQRLLQAYDRLNAFSLSRLEELSASFCLNSQDLTASLNASADISSNMLPLPLPLSGIERPDSANVNRLLDELQDLSSIDEAAVTAVLARLCRVALIQPRETVIRQASPAPTSLAGFSRPASRSKPLPFDGERDSLDKRSVNGFNARPASAEMHSRARLSSSVQSCVRPSSAAPIVRGRQTSSISLSSPATRSLPTANGSIGGDGFVFTGRSSRAVQSLVLDGSHQPLHASYQSPLGFGKEQQNQHWNRLYEDLSPMSLHAAAYNQHANLVRSLANRGMAVNGRDWLRRTPLHIGCLRGDVQVVRVLLESHADSSLEDQSGNSPLGLYLEYFYPHVDNSLILALLQAGALPSEQEWQFLLDLSVEQDDPAFVVEAMKGPHRFTVSLSDTTDELRFSIVRAAEHGARQVVEALLQNKSRRECRVIVLSANKQGLNSIDVAERNGYTELAQYLRSFTVAAPESTPMVTTELDTEPDSFDRGCASSDSHFDSQVDSPTSGSVSLQLDSPLQRLLPVDPPPSEQISRETMSDPMPVPDRPHAFVFSTRILDPPTDPSFDSAKTYRLMADEISTLKDEQKSRNKEVQELRELVQELQVNLTRHTNLVQQLSQRQITMGLPNSTPEVLEEQSKVPVPTVPPSNFEIARHTKPKNSRICVVM